MGEWVVRKGGEQSRAAHQPDPLAFLRLIQSQPGSRFVGREQKTPWMAEVNSETPARESCLSFQLLRQRGLGFRTASGGCARTHTAAAESLPLD